MKIFLQHKWQKNDVRGLGFADEFSIYGTNFELYQKYVFPFVILNFSNFLATGLT